MNMRLSQIKYVLAVVECGSFSQAAKKLFISQPSLSESIINLEKQLGVTLFDRASTPVRLTYAGEVYIKTATQIQELCIRLQRELSDLGDTPRGHLIVGTSQFVTTYIMPHILLAFREQYPDIEVSLVEALGDEREEYTLKGEIDLFFTTSPVKNERLHYDSVMEERILLALPPIHPFNPPEALERQERVILTGLRSLPYPYTDLPAEADFPLIELSQLQTEPFVMLRSDLSLHKLGLRLCKLSGFTPHIRLESRSIDATRAMAIAGLGCAFIPESIVRFSSFFSHPVYYLMAGLLPVRDLNIACRKDRYHSKAMMAFINTVRAILRAPLSALPPA
jgi:DNA-binding transcriptional LysR family regulator